MKLSSPGDFPASATAQDAPEISVVMPVYNASLTLAATVSSVLRQEGCCFELIAIDDGSSDASLALLLELAAADERIHVVARANGGVSSARNLGVDLARAPLVAFLDADDLWAPDKLARHVAAHAEKAQAVASYARIAFIGADATGLAGARTLSTLCPHTPVITDVLGENPVCTASNLVVRREAFLAAGGFDASLSYAEDQEFVARLIHQGGQVAGVDGVLTGYRLSPDGLSMDLERMYAGWRIVAGRYLSADEQAPLEALYCRYLARRTLRGGGSPAQARRYVMAGLRRDSVSFLAERKRGLATIFGAIIAPLLPATARMRLFA